MNLREAKRAGPSFPKNIQWGFETYCKCLDKHPENQISEGDLLIFVVSRISGELSAILLGIYQPEGGVRLERLGVFNEETSQGQSHALRYHTLHYPLIGLYNSYTKVFHNNS